MTSWAELLSGRRRPRRTVGRARRAEPLSASHPPTAAARCARCEHGRAYYFQLQIRSADEPMTTFYKCAGCGFQWNDNN